MTNLLSAEKISFAYNNAPTLTEIDFALASGALRALLGPNGSGKTTLLKVLTGILPPARGAVKYAGADLKSMSRREIARRIALVPQELNLQFGFTVRQMVMLGRTPHTGALSGPSKQDRAIVQDVMEMTEIGAMQDRVITELSGGEQQRVVIAMALAQEPHVLLLDEPTVHLDINHQIEILDLVRKLNRERGLTVLATMHDLNLAALYFDDLVLLERGRIVAQGAPSEVLSAERIHAVFNANVLIQPHPARTDAPQVILLPAERHG
ncbi:MAG: Iron(3+)-hydroxamate import ATP-binding protein FhuC [Anaerolineae bacterium]|nr:Iron(3+)-hydroxamate import ATP-binding protein FhuC [Anaerolineae bacterium]RIK17219.1 MAG: heme ABC transporter ATP-binding protein [Chloroflexota bacterium]